MTKTLTVRSLNDPEITTFHQGKTYRFNSGLCKMPANIALRIVQNNANYVIDSGSADKPSVLEPFNPKTWTQDYKKIIFDAPSGFANGYGKAAMMLAQGLIEEGIDLHVINSHWATNSKKHMPEIVEQAMDKGETELDSFYVKLFPANEFKNVVAERFIGFSMLEASHVGQPWVDAINANCEALVVPCEQNRNMFRNSGVLKDIGVVGLGIDPELFPYKKRELDKQDFVFGIMGTLTYRKGVDILMEAFRIAFGDNENVRLYIKTRDINGKAFNYYLNKEQIKGNDPQIVLNTSVMSPDQLVKDFFHKIDCFVFPTRGEGFGLPPLEAMATGLPVIATNWSGPAEYMRHNHSYPLSCNMVPVPYDEGLDGNGRKINKDFRGYPPEIYNPKMHWAEVDPEELAEKMVDVYENQEKAIRKGQRAAKYVRNNWSHRHAACRLIDFLDKIA